MQELENYRKQIDEIDIELIDILSRRFEVVRAVGNLKSQTGLSVVQSERAEAVKKRAAEMGKNKNLNPEFIRNLYELMIAHAHDLEHDILEKNKNE